MRLIDADMLMKEIQSFRCSITGLRAGKGVLAHAADEYRKSILQIIDDQPTAFDKEKVIEKIKDESRAEHLEDVSISGNVYGYNIERVINEEDVIEIVEKGGLN